MTHITRPFIPAALVGSGLVALALTTGCTTTAVTRHALPDADQRAAAHKTPAYATPLVEVFELTAGGVREKRDDWTKQATPTIDQALAKTAGYGPSAALSPATEQELAEVRALLQLIATNHAMMSMFGPRELRPAERPLSYNLGRMDRIFDELHVDALLVTSIHDEYSTGGRKALMALGVLAGAVTGVYVIPTGGAAANTAALVERDGTVVWFKYAGGGGDLRTPEGAQTTVRQLLSGLPARPVASSAGL